MVLSQKIVGTLVEFSRLVTGTLSEDELLPRLVKAATEHVGADAAMVLRVVGPMRAVVAAAADLPVDRTGTEFEVDAFDAEAIARLCPECAEAFDRTHVVPLVSQGGLFGVLVVFFRGRDGQGDDDRLVLFEALADLAAVALQNIFQHAELERSHAEIRESRERFAQTAALRALGQMASVVAHEVKNPLAAIGGALQVIQSRMPDDSSERRVMGDVLGRLESLNVLVSELLDFARPREPQLRRLDLRRLLRDTAGLLLDDPLFEGVDVSLDGPEVEVDAEAGMLREVFVNLLRNAAQAMDGAGTVRLRLEAEERTVTVAVEDEGPGIPEADRERIFEAFFTTKARGTGLGLAIVRQRVRAHGGDIACEVAPSGGARMAVTLPRSGYQVIDSE